MTLEHHVRDYARSLKRRSEGKKAAIAEDQDESSVLRNFDDAIDRLGDIAREASDLVTRNADNIVLIKAGNDRIERLIAANQVALDRLVALPAA